MCLEDELFTAPRARLLSTSFIQIITLRYNLLKLGALWWIFYPRFLPPPFRTINTSLKLILLGRILAKPFSQLQNGDSLNYGKKSRELPTTYTLRAFPPKLHSNRAARQRDRDRLNPACTTG